jgi:hypothetical protein
MAKRVWSIPSNVNPISYLLSIQLPMRYDMVKLVRWTRSISPSKRISFHDRDMDACFDVQPQQGRPAGFLGHWGHCYLTTLATQAILRKDMEVFGVASHGNVPRLHILVGVPV